MSKDKKQEEKEIKVFNYGDFHLKCHNCGHDEIVAKNVKGGLRMDIYTTDQHKLIMECSECGAKLEYYFTEAANPPKEEEDEDKDEEVQDKVETESEPQSAEEESVPVDNTEVVQEPQEAVEVTE